MRPVLTAAEVAAVDRVALASATHDELVARAGRRLASGARRLLDGRPAGRRVVVLAGRGSNGADGRVAGRWLERWGASVLVVDAFDAPDRLPACDLVVDAALGTGGRPGYQAPDPGGVPVLACDLPSGLDADTGAADGGVLPATETVALTAWKRGLLLGEGPRLAGRVVVEPIGLEPADAGAWLVEDADVDLLPARARDAHKWRSAVLVVAGQPGVLGAPTLCSRAAFRAGAGYVVLGVPGVTPGEVPPDEHVGRALPADRWDTALGDVLGRVAALAVGPGLGATAATTRSVRALLERFSGPVVVDADGLHDLDVGRLRGRGPTILTPHEGEFARLFGPVGQDRVAVVQEAARRSGAVVLLKGPTTVVADPSGAVRFAAAGTSALATAGTGDVLTGVVAALLAQGLAPLDAAAVGAHLHGAASRLGPSVGLVAGDLPPLVSRWLSQRHAR